MLPSKLVLTAIAIIGVLPTIFIVMSNVYLDIFHNTYNCHISEEDRTIFYNGKEIRHERNMITRDFTGWKPALIVFLGAAIFIIGAYHSISESSQVIQVIQGNSGNSGNSGTVHHEASPPPLTMKMPIFKAGNSGNSGTGLRNTAIIMKPMKNDRSRNAISTGFDDGCAPGSRVWDFAYNDAGQPTGYTWPNGMNTEYTYDTAGRLTKIEHKDNGTVRAGWEYTLSDGGNILRMASTVSGSDQAWEYAYDARNRLAHALRRDEAGLPEFRMAYEYDLADNMTSKKKIPLELFLYDNGFDDGDYTSGPGVDGRQRARGRRRAMCWRVFRALRAVTSIRR